MLGEKYEIRDPENQAVVGTVQHFETHHTSSSAATGGLPVASARRAPVLLLGRRAGASWADVTIAAFLKRQQEMLDAKVSSQAAALPSSAGIEAGEEGEGPAMTHLFGAKEDEPAHHEPEHNHGHKHWKKHEHEHEHEHHHEHEHEHEHRHEHEHEHEHWEHEHWEHWRHWREHHHGCFFKFWRHFWWRHHHGPQGGPHHGHHGWMPHPHFGPHLPPHHGPFGPDGPDSPRHWHPHGGHHGYQGHRSEEGEGLPGFDALANMLSDMNAMVGSDTPAQSGADGAAATRGPWANMGDRKLPPRAARVWASLESTAQPVAPGDDEIDWRVHGNGGTLNWGLVAFAGLAAACGFVWLTLLAHAFRFCCRRRTSTQFVVFRGTSAGELSPLLSADEEALQKGGLVVAGAHVAPGASLKPVIDYQPLKQ